MEAAVRAVADLSEAEPSVDAETRRVKVAVGNRGSQALVEAVRRLDSAGVETKDLALHRPSLDDVFLRVTGHAAEAASDGARRRGMTRDKSAVGG
jgi:ABC-2 type transport system ATP-binding protein